jgi:hypothetical protein
MPPLPSPTTLVTTGITDANISATAKPSERCREAIVLASSPKLLFVAVATAARGLYHREEGGEQLRPLGLPGYRSISTIRRAASAKLPVNAEALTKPNLFPETPHLYAFFS